MQWRWLSNYHTILSKNRGRGRVNKDRERGQGIENHQHTKNGYTNSRSGSPNNWEMGFSIGREVKTCFWHMNEVTRTKQGKQILLKTWKLKLFWWSLTQTRKSKHMYGSWIQNIKIIVVGIYNHSLP